MIINNMINIYNQMNITDLDIIKKYAEKIKNDKSNGK